MSDIYEVTVEPRKMLGMCRWTKNGNPINGIYVPAKVLCEIVQKLDMEIEMKIKKIASLG